MKKEIRKRLERLQKAIERGLECDSMKWIYFPHCFLCLVSFGVKVPKNL